MTVAEVYHNVAIDLDGRPLGMLDGYQPEHPLTLVARLKVSGSVLKDQADEYPALEEIFRLLNVGDDPDYGEPDPQAQAYRLWGNRSLSVGDVVKLQGGRWFAVARIGWVTIPEPAVFASQLGTRDLARDE